MIASNKPDRRYLPVLTLKTAAQLANLPIEAIETAVETGALRVTPFFEEVRKVTPADLEQWLQARSKGGR